MLYYALLSYPSEDVCAECEVNKLPRSKHCDICNRCVSVYDHHCPWINNCVKCIDRSGRDSKSCNLLSFYIWGLGKHDRWNSFDGLSCIHRSINRLWGNFITLRYGEVSVLTYLRILGKERHAYTKFTGGIIIVTICGSLIIPVIILISV